MTLYNIIISDPTVEVTDATISINKFIEFRIFRIRDCYDWVVSI